MMKPSLLRAFGLLVLVMSLAASTSRAVAESDDLRAELPSSY